MDPFATKGIEYLLVIGYLSLFVPFAWLVSRMARGRLQPEGAAAVGPAKTLPASTAAGSWFQLPEDFHFHRGHTWAVPVGDGVFKVGMNDFAQRLIGPAAGLVLPEPGHRLQQGEKGWRVQANGDGVDLLSPVHGEVVDVNQEALRTPSLVSEDPYGQGWLLKVRVGSESAALKNLLPGRLARVWIDEASEELSALVGGDLGPVLQDGGVPVPGFARQLAGDRWPEIAARLLLTA